MPRPISGVLTFPLESLRHPHVVSTPELAASGIHLEVVAVDDVPALTQRLSAEALARLPEHKRKLVDAEPFFAVSVSSPEPKLALLDGSGAALGGPRVNGEYRYWTRDLEDRAVALEVRIPVVFPPRAADPLSALQLAVAELVGDGADELLSRFTPGVRLIPTAVANYDDVPLGASRLNGRPDLPEDMRWPHWTGPNGDDTGPLTFLAQINLAYVPAIAGDDLPEAGWLVFFADAGRSFFQTPPEQAARRVVYLPADAELAPCWGPWRHEHYAKLQTGGGPLMGYGRPAVVDFELVTTAPYSAIEEAALQLPEPSQTELLEALDTAREAQHWHQMLGQPNPSENDPILGALRSVTVNTLAHLDEAERRATLVEEASEWRVLLQLLDDFELRTEWGPGSLYFVIRHDALADGQFDQVVVDSQD